VVGFAAEDVDAAGEDASADAATPGAAFVHVLVTGSYTSCVGPVRPSLAERPPIRWIDPSTAALARWLRGVGIGARSGCHVSVDGS
jgi:hypothetical protein